MRAQPIAMGPLARPAAFLPLSLLLAVGGTFLAGPARAAGSVTFKQMIVERCPESSCEWRLSCGVDGPQETEFFAGESAKTKYKININRTLEARRFPVTVHCTAWEDDGWFGASWEKVNSGSVEVPAGGEFRLDLANRDQGTVRILMSVDSLEMAMPAEAKPAAASATPKKGSAAKPAPAWRFTGTFNPSPEGRAVVIGMEWKPFKEMVDKLSGHGIQIETLSSFEQGGKRLWNGILRNSHDQVVLLSDQDWDKFSGSWKKLTGGQSRLTDLEIYQKGGQNTFAGIFRNLGESHAFWVGQKRDEFTDKIKELSEGKGQKLIDVEVYRPSAGGSSTLLYAGPFRQSNLEARLWTGLKREALDTKLKEIRGKEWQVVNVQAYKDGKDRNYDVLLRTGPGGEVVVGLDDAAFTAKWRELAAKGLRLVGVEVYQE